MNLSSNVPEKNASGVLGSSYSRRHRLLRWPIFSLVVLFVMICLAVFAPIIVPHDENLGFLEDRHQPPVLFGGTSNHILGTDSLGRDVFSRVVYGARISMLSALTALVIGGAIGTALGIFAGYMGGWVDELIMRLVDVKFSIPLILIAFAMVVIFSPSFGLLIGLLTMFVWGQFTRQVRAEVLVIKTTDYVAAARTWGASPAQIMYRHIFPGVISTVLMIATFQSGAVILAEATLSFLGAGVPPPSPSWGAMIADGRLYLDTAWWVSLAPGIAMGLFIAAITLLGDWLRDYWDPKLRQL
jgi:peptide/nickel transport system permease protein